MAITNQIIKIVSAPVIFKQAIGLDMMDIKFLSEFPLSNVTSLADKHISCKSFFSLLLPVWAAVTIATTYPPPVIFPCIPTVKTRSRAELATRLFDPARVSLKFFTAVLTGCYRWIVNRIGARKRAINNLVVSRNKCLIASRTHSLCHGWTVTFQAAIMTIPRSIRSLAIKGYSTSLAYKLFSPFERFIPARTRTETIMPFSSLAWLSAKFFTTGLA